MIELPWLGLGTSSNLDVKGRPHPYRMIDRAPGLFDYLEYSAPLDLDHAREEASLFETMWSRRDQVRPLFHPVHLNLYGPELENKASLAALDRHLAEVGSPWVSNDVAWWHAAGRVFPGHLYLPPPLTHEGLEDVVRHALHVQGAIRAPLLLENPALFTPRGPLHVLDFMSELHRRTRLGLLIDVGHLLSHQLARGLPLDSGLDGFAFEAVIELHVAGGVITERQGRRFYADDHPQPIRDEVFELLERIVPRCTNLRALTYEADGHPEPIAENNLRLLRKILPQRPAEHVTLQQPTAAEQKPLLSDPWALYELVFKNKGEASDPLGEEVERDFRLAVLAERIDKTFPLSRAVLAADRTALLDFSASEELEQSFRGRGRTYEESFMRWARRKVRETNDEAAAAIVAIEGFARDVLYNQPPPPRSAKDGIALAPGVVLATLPKDLTEAQHARLAIDRHLSGRARAAGVFEAEGLEGLRQTINRAPERPWSVAIRERGGRLEIVGLDSELENALKNRLPNARALEMGLLVQTGSGSNTTNVVP